MGVAEILHEIEALPSEEQALIFTKLRDLTVAEVPESLRESMAEAAAGNLIEFDEALTELDRP